MITKRQVQEFADKLRIDQFTVYREYLQIIILNSLYELDNSKELIFKGGTALRLIYGSPRFSEDLDFTSHCKPEEVKKVLSRLLKRVKEEIPNVYFKYLDSLAGLQAKFFLPLDISTQDLSVKTDFSFRNKAENIKQTVVKTPLPVASFSLLQVMAKEEILAEKICAIYTRFQGRDIYDFWWLVNNGTDFKKDLITKKLKKIKLQYNLNSLIKKIENYSDRKLVQDLNKFLPLSDRKILPHLKGFLLERLKSKL